MVPQYVSHSQKFILCQFVGHMIIFDQCSYSVFFNRTKQYVLISSAFTIIGLDAMEKYLPNVFRGEIQTNLTFIVLLFL